MLYKSIFLALLGSAPVLATHRGPTVDHAKRHQPVAPNELSKRDYAHLLWPANGPSIAEVVDWQAELPPAVSVVLFAIVKCNHKWLYDLFFWPVPFQDGEFRSDNTWFSFYDAQYRRVASGITTTGDPSRSGWPKHYWTAFSATVLPDDPWKILGNTSVNSLDAADLLRIFTGLPTFSWTAADYGSRPGSFEFAVERSSESPIVFQSSANATTLKPSTYYVLSTPNKGANNSPQVWSPGPAKTPYALTDVPMDKLRADIGRLAHINDFKRWTQSGFLPCSMVAGKFTCS